MPHWSPPVRWPLTAPTRRRGGRHGKVAWRIEGRVVCRKPPATSKRPVAEAALIGQVVGPAPVQRVGRSRRSDSAR
ncbi:MAG: hypothetical protein U0R26_11985 [Solirubrobacterales bacterium]